MLENGDLIFVRDGSDMGQAIQTSTGNYSHVAIYLDGMIYHASGQAGVVCQEPADFFESNHLYDLYVYPEMDIQSVKEELADILEHPTMLLSIQMQLGFYCSQYIAEILPIFETIPMKFGDGELGD